MVSIDYTLILVIINFIILMIVLKKLLYKPLMDFLNKRENQIKDDLDAARKNKTAAEKILEEQKELLREAKEQAREIRDEAQKSARIHSEQILKDATEQRDIIIREAQEMINVEVIKAKESIQKEIGNFVVELTDKVIGKKLSKDEDIKLINELIELELKKESPVD
ncbi:MAG TPA: ATP synthase F0 subunit B [Candidatus Cloacimonetes bacterium]|nr:ATP synthase F0 subunit B [Candidatus Cloacimonadota bacterium]